MKMNCDQIFIFQVRLKEEKETETSERGGEKIRKLLIAKENLFYQKYQ